jgi:hypothetical protein
MLLPVQKIVQNSEIVSAFYAAHHLSEVSFKAA